MSINSATFQEFPFTKSNRYQRTLDHLEISKHVDSNLIIHSAYSRVWLLFFWKCLLTESYCNLPWWLNVWPKMKNESNQTQSSQDWYLSKYNTATPYNNLYKLSYSQLTNLPYQPILSTWKIVRRPHSNVHKLTRSNNFLKRNTDKSTIKSSQIT